MVDISFLFRVRLPPARPLCYSLPPLSSSLPLWDCRVNPRVRVRVSVSVSVGVRVMVGVGVRVRVRVEVRVRVCVRVRVRG